MDLAGMFGRTARRLPTREALVYEGKRYTYGELDAAISSFANGLIALGVKKGDKVALMMENTDKFVIAYYGALRAGGVVVPLNFRLTAPEAAYILDHSDSETFVFDPTFQPIVDVVRRELARVRNYVVAGEATKPDVLSMDTLLASHPGRYPDVTVDEQDDCEILYTSGTTGRPKGALFDHHRIVTVAVNAICAAGIKEDDRIIHVAPLFHSAELNLFLNSGSYVGATHVVVRTFEPKKVMETLQNEKITFFFGVPTMFAFLIRLPDFDKYDISALQRAGYGAAPMAPAMVKAVIERFGTESFYNLCGLTEGGPGGIALPPRDQIRKAGAGGKPIVNTEARVVTEDMRDVVVGQVGELVLRGETMMKCYYKDAAATADTFKGGWLHTGDLAVVDEEGYITLVDRKKDMIITGGENVYSKEVEDVVFGAPGIADVAVIGVPHPVWGETVAAIVVPKPGATVTVEDLRAYCADKLADYKIPRIVKIAEALPRNPSGKVLKTNLREVYRAP